MRPPRADLYGPFVFTDIVVVPSDRTMAKPEEDPRDTASGKAVPSSMSDTSLVCVLVVPLLTRDILVSAFFNML